MNPAENYILNQPEPYCTIMMQLQIIIERTLPEAELLFKWKVPFYYIDKRPLCYLNHTKDYVDLGFWNSSHLTTHLEYLISADRKKIKSLRYKSVRDINNNVLTEILQNAYLVRNKKFW